VATQEVYYVLFGAIVLVIIFVAFLLLALQRLKRRKTQLLSDLKNSPRLNSDRAFNRLAMARREAEIVARQGIDVTRARELIAQSQSALDLRQFERSYELAQSAHESLVAARQGRPLSSATAPAREPMASRSAPPPVTTAGPSPALPPSAAGGSGVPANRVQSSFEMHLLDSELAAARLNRPNDPATATAADFQAQAQSAFDSARYTDALRLALKGRRGLGGNVESVPPGPGTHLSISPPGAGDAMGAALDPGASAERAASAARCPDCGYPITPDDLFCRGCGTTRAPPTCSRCGTPRTPADTFCGRCGERFS
jgi:cell division septation protein DedD